MYGYRARPAGAPGAGGSAGGYLVPRTDRAAGVALLLGAVAALMIVGTGARFAVSSESWPDARGVVCAGVLGALALGVARAAAVCRLGLCRGLASVRAARGGRDDAGRLRGCLGDGSSAPLGGVGGGGVGGWGRSRP